jgi:hypothetical protein
MTTTTEAPGPETAPTTAEVRAWAERRHLLEPGGRGRISAEIWGAYADERAAAAAAGAAALEAAGAPPAAVAESHAVGVKELAADPPPPGRAEEPPERPRKPLRERLHIVRADQPDQPRKPRAHKRVSLEVLGGLAWVGVSRGVAFAGETYLPVVKMMSFQAPVAGAVVEDLARGTIADRILQPVARLTESGGAVGALIGAPLLTALVCKRPELYPQVQPMLMAAMREWVIVAGPKLREMRRREEKFAEEMGTFTAEFGVTVEELLAEVFAAPAPAGPPQTAAANGQP